jgi:tRNA pseudouridine65 synthase
MELEILYIDNYLCAINKPHGLLVHRSKIAADASEFAIQLLRNQLGKPVYPGHRLDRKTGGVLVFGLEKSMDAALQTLFMDKQVEKTYLAVVRGFTDNEGQIDYPLRKENGTLQEALTIYKTIARAEIPLSDGRFATSRYSLVEVMPKTGRFHQIRKHFKHIFHPIIGDRPHGCNKQNRLFLENYGMNTMLLHAFSLQFKHPVNGRELTLRAKPQSEFSRMINILQIQEKADEYFQKVNYPLI